MEFTVKASKTPFTTAHAYGELHITIYLFFPILQKPHNKPKSGVVSIDLLHYLYKPVTELRYDDVLLFQKDDFCEVVQSTYNRYI